MKKLLFIIIALFLLANVAFAQDSRKFELDRENYAQIPELVIQESPSETVSSVKFSKDGKYLAASTVNEMRIFEVETGILLKTYTMYRSGDFSPDGKYIVYRSTKTDIEICTVATGKKRFVSSSPTISDTAAWNTYFTFSADGKYFAFTNYDTVDLYNTETLEKEQELSVQYMYFNAPITFSADSQYISVLGSPDPKKYGASTGVWNIKTGTFKTHFNASMYPIYYSDINEKYVAYASPKEIVIWDITSHSKVTTLTLSELGTIKGVQFSSDGKYLYTLQEKRLTIWSNVINTGDWQKIHDFDMNSAQSLTLDFNQKIYAIGRFRSVTIKEFNKVEPLKTITGISNLVHLYQNSNDGTFFVSDNDLKSRGWLDKDFAYHAISAEITRNAQLVAPFNGGFYFALKNDTKTKIYKYTLGDDKSVWIMDAPINKMVANSDGTMLLCAMDKGTNQELYIYDTKNGFVKWGKYSNKLANIKELNGVLSKFSPTNHFIFVRENDSFYPSTIYDTKKKKAIEFKEEESVLNATKMTSGDFSPDEKLFAATIEEKVKVYKTSSWKAVKIFENSYYPFFSDDGQYLGMTYFENGWNIAVYSVSDWKLVQKIATKDAEAKMKFTNDKSKIIVLDSAGIVRCYSLETGAICFSTIVDAHDDWLTYTPAGYFSGSDGGMKNFVHLVTGMNVIELGQVAETLYRPDIVSEKINENRSDEKKENLLTELVSNGEPPCIEILNSPANSISRDITVDFTVQDMGGGIGSIYISHNGKVIQISNNTRKLELETENAAQSQNMGGKKLQVSQFLTLQNGENIIEAFATNSAGKIESRHAVTKITWNGTTAKPNLYVLAVGVNAYNTSGVSPLRYCVVDAQSIVQMFQKNTGNIYASVHATVLADDKVTKPQIHAEFERLSQKVQPDDIFIFYVSGHGTAYNGDYYFISYDFDGKQLGSAVSKAFIRENLSLIRAAKTLVLLDTCNAGAIVSGSGGDTNTAFARLSHSTGQAIIAAASDTQSAIEGYNGHGVFTYAVLDALSGKANYENDDEISLLELNLYVSANVPKFTKSKWNHEQNPWYDLRKQDFPLVGK